MAEPTSWLVAERAVLGSLLQDNNCFAEIGDSISASDFQGKGHGAIYSAIKRLIENNQDADAVTVLDLINQREDKEAANEVLQEVLNEPFSVSSLHTYIDLLRRNAVQRKLRLIIGDLEDVHKQPGTLTADELVDKAGECMHKLTSPGADGRMAPKSYETALDSALESMEKLQKSDRPYPGIESGFTDLDDMTLGFQRGDLIIIAGRPSMGKTTFALNVAQKVIKNPQEENNVLFFSLEMSAESLVMRMLATEARVNLTTLRGGNISAEDSTKLVQAGKGSRNWKFFIDDAATLSPSSLRSRTRRLVQHHGELDLVIVDYLQLMRGDTHYDNRVIEITHISSSLKALARELNVPVIALSQLSRDVEKRSNPHPKLSDLRDSGAIEQDADVICFIHRPEVNDKDSPEKGLADIVVAKQRNGPTGVVQLRFLGEHTVFRNLEKADSYPQHS